MIPILFTTKMHRAILEGRKTQTRRVVTEKWLPLVQKVLETNGKWVWDTVDFELKTPYGKPGDLLLVGPRIEDTLILEVTDIRVERLHDITDADVKAEGFESIEGYRIAWELIFGKYGNEWGKNPWVWVIDFKIQKEKGL